MSDGVDKAFWAFVAFFLLWAFVLFLKLTFSMPGKPPPRPPSPIRPVRRRCKVTRLCEHHSRPIAIGTMALIDAGRCEVCLRKENS